MRLPSGVNMALSIGPAWPLSASSSTPETACLSAMGLILLREGLERRREANASTAKLVAAIRGESADFPTASS